MVWQLLLSVTFNVCGFFSLVMAVSASRDALKIRNGFAVDGAGREWPASAVISGVIVLYPTAFVFLWAAIKVWWLQ